MHTNTTIPYASPYLLAHYTDNIHKHHTTILGDVSTSNRGERQVTRTVKSSHTKGIIYIQYQPYHTIPYIPYHTYSFTEHNSLFLVYIYPLLIFLLLLLLLTYSYSPTFILLNHLLTVSYPTTLQAIHNYALFLQCCGDLEEAEDMHVKVTPTWDFHFCHSQFFTYTRHLLSFYLPRLVSHIR